jgi:hypothetical protein
LLNRLLPEVMRFFWERSFVVLPFRLTPVDLD